MRRTGSITTCSSPSIRQGQLNNGQPSFWAHNFDHLDLQRGERVLQVGAGTGYYSAILAEIVGPAGRVTAVEYDADLAARARANLAPWRHVEVVAGDGRLHDAGEVDAVVAFAGSTHPAPLWLDRLADDGRLMMPLTVENRWGFMLRATRRGSEFAAASIGWVGIFPCIGGRDHDAAQRLRAGAQGGARPRSRRPADPRPASRRTCARRPARGLVSRAGLLARTDPGQRDPGR